MDHNCLIFILLHGVIEHPVHQGTRNIPTLSVVVRGTKSILDGAFFLYITVGLKGTAVQRDFLPPIFSQMDFSQAP